jgi:hypothetical protein
METIAATVTDTGSPINPAELAEFLYLFRGANVALSELIPKASQQSFREPTTAEIETSKQRLAAYSPRHLDSFFDPCRAPNLLVIQRITQNSPLEIVLLGSPLLVVLAVILSGGRIQFSATGVKAVVPPLGKGIKYLREAFGLDKQLQAGFGIREITIKLSKSEFQELMTPITGSGGFQSFFRGLQNRVNKQTRKLTLSQQDLERIYRHKSEPQKGGWQARLEGVFGRHLPDNHSG